MTTNSKKLASTIFEILESGLEQHFGTNPTGRDLLERFCRERANNIAQGLLVDVPRLDIERSVDRLLDLWPRLFAAQDVAERAIDAEGSPAVKDTFGGFMAALNEALTATTKMNEVATKHIGDLHEVLCVEEK